MAWHRRKPEVIPFYFHQSTRNLSQDTLCRAQQIQNYIRNWHCGGPLMSVGGLSCDAYYNPWYENGDEGDFDTDIFYVVSRFPPKLNPLASYRHLAGVVVPWDYSNACRPAINWYPDYDQSDGSFGTALELYRGSRMTTDSKADPKLKATNGTTLSPIELYQDFYLTPDSSGGYHVGALAFEGIQIAAMSIFGAPDRILSDRQAGVLARDVSIGDIARGYDPTSSMRDSVGTLIHLAGSKSLDDDEDTCERVQRPCYFQWGNQRGILLDNVTDYTDIFNGHSIKIHPRNLFGNPTIDLDVAIVVSGAACRGTITEVGTSPANAVNFAVPSNSWPTLDVTTIEGCDATSDIFIKIEMENASAETQTVIHTVAIWEH